ncbi:aminodeoxychorismate synthase component I [Corynebacterium kroppenstedtii]|jgi:para-aminobenzoate synthetase component I|uniref:Aminodeoxychorismate synthase component I n=1 Tax=Corynebacterium kroppenstedtii TaxID=161879 RepID=A0A2W5SVG2_9CORY|nr:aminodeoxychorismate synthase component I [Corynebacterium kroppenstedtii]MDU7287100.1 aminodeoxychorismate synthase component I [Corynebacterium kroppenstedtii]PZR03526.1 MAG: aminodeoxychorismate synthase component I [Corynebacterium kroppenstedtii]
MVPGIFDAPHDDSASVTRLGYSSLDPVDVGVSLLINDDLPAMAIGAWGRLEAVIAPDALCTYCDPDEALTPPPGVFAASDSPSGNDDESTVNDSDPRNGVRFGFISYPDPTVYAAGVTAHQVIWRRDREWFTNGDSDCAEGILATANQRRDHHSADELSVPTHWSTGDRESHRRGVFSCLDAIRAGEVYQACISAQFRTPMTSRADAARWWLSTVHRTRPRYAMFLATHDRAIASLSPELFLERRGSTVWSSPIKGTIPIDRAPGELARSRKDVAENIMIVDLVRNDLSRVCNDVTVPSLLEVVPAPGVWHLVSTVSGQVADLSATQDSRIIDACFPPASVTGTPKLRAREYLAEWEPVPRGIHCGTVGMNWGDLVANVAIRTAEWVNGELILGTGGGITIDSTADAEWAEIMAKTSTLRW